MEEYMQKYNNWINDSVIDEEAKNYETIIFSAGKIGYQVELNLEDLKKVIKIQLSDIVD